MAKVKSPVQKAIHFEKDDVQRADKLCKELGISFSALIRLALRERLDGCATCPVVHDLLRIRQLTQDSLHRIDPTFSAEEHP